MDFAIHREIKARVIQLLALRYDASDSSKSNHTQVSSRYQQPLHRNIRIDDLTVVRHATACKLDVKAAAESIVRRAVFLLHTFDPNVFQSQANFTELHALLPCYWAGPAADARNSTSPVLLISISSTFDSAKFLEACGGNGRLFVEWFGEKIVAKCREAKQEKVTVVVDLRGASVGQMNTVDMNRFIHIAAIHLQSMLPEYLNQVYLINAPKTFSVMMYSLKRVCHEQTVKKFSILRSVQDVFAHIPQTQIPKSMGGLASSEEPDVCMFFQNMQESYKHPPKSPLAASRSMTKSSSENDDDDRTTKASLEKLRELLRDAIEKRKQCEARHLEENARLRRKLRLIDMQSSQIISEEEHELRKDLVAILDERDAYRRAVGFARNFIEQEEAVRRSFRAEIEREIEAKRKENIALLGILESSMGLDAKSLFSL